MLSYTRRRLALTIPVLLGVVTLIFPQLHLVLPDHGLRDWLSPR